MEVNTPQPLLLEAKRTRVACFIDGFNLFHAIKNLGRNELKWVNLWKLMECFADPKVHKIVAVYYFSAYATWIKEAFEIHQAYVAALECCGVRAVFGKFKEKQLSCFDCHREWLGHEEKQSDVNIAIWMIREAFRNNYDEAFLVTQDSDLVPAVEFIREMPRARKIKIISPPGKPHSKELCRYATNKAKIKEIHLERCLMPQEVKNPHEIVVATRPTKYDPPISK
jgi:uncharacterized LabA/DUF88 family protein